MVKIKHGDSKMRKKTSDEIYEEAIKLRNQLETLIDELKGRAQSGDSQALEVYHSLRKALAGIDKR